MNLDAHHPHPPRKSSPGHCSRAASPTGKHVTDPFRGWDMSVCHAYYPTDNGQQILGMFCPHA